MQIRIKFLAHCLNRLYAECFELLGQLRINLLHAGHERIILVRLLDGIKASLKVIHNRKNLLNYAPLTHGEHLLLLLIGSLAVIIKLCHLPAYSILQGIDLLLHSGLLLVRLLVLGEEALLVCGLRFGICLRVPGCLLRSSFGTGISTIFCLKLFFRLLILNRDLCGILHFFLSGIRILIFFCHSFLHHFLYRVSSCFMISCMTPITLS